MKGLIVAIAGMIIMAACAVFEITMEIVMGHRLKEFEKWADNARNWHEE